MANGKFTAITIKQATSIKYFMCSGFFISDSTGITYQQKIVATIIAMLVSPYHAVYA